MGGMSEERRPTVLVWLVETAAETWKFMSQMREGGFACSEDRKLYTVACTTISVGSLFTSVMRKVWLYRIAISLAR